MENRLEEIFEEVDKIDDHTTNVCINCGSKLGDDYTTHCDICGYDLEEPFTCPYTVLVNMQNLPVTNFCQLTKKLCKIKGLDYEVCSVFRSLDSIKDD